MIISIDIIHVILLTLLSKLVFMLSSMILYIVVIFITVNFIIIIVVTVIRIAVTIVITLLSLSVQKPCQMRGCSPKDRTSSMCSHIQVEIKQNTEPCATALIIFCYENGIYTTNKSSPKTGKGKNSCTDIVCLIFKTNVHTHRYFHVYIVKPWNYNDRWKYDNFTWSSILFCIEMLCGMKCYSNSRCCFTNEVVLWRCALSAFVASR